MANNRPKRVFFRKRDLFVLGALLLLAAGLFLFLKLGAAPARVAVVTIGTGDSQRTERLDLGTDRRVDLDAKLPVHLVIEDGGIYFTESVCPDHLCEGFGVLREEGDWAACLPAEVTVRIE